MQISVILLSISNDVTIEINEVQIKNSQSKKLLRITTDNYLKFENHINNICGKASAKISALSRIAPDMDLPKRKQIMNAFFFKSQFSYGPLTWMMHSRKLKDVVPLSTSSNYNIRSRRTFTTRSIKTVFYGTELLSYIAPKAWERILNNIKSLENLPKFKRPK